MAKPDKSNILKFKSHRYLAAVFEADNLDANAIGRQLISVGAHVIGQVRLNDTYYEVPEGVLKLREVQGRADVTLMYYVSHDAGENEKGGCLVFTLSPSGYFKQVFQELLQIKAAVKKVGKKFTLDDVHILLVDVESKDSRVELELRVSLDPRPAEASMLRLRKLGELLGFSADG